MTSELRAIIGFTSGAVTGTIEPINAAFGEDNRTFTFSITGVTYSGRAEAGNGPGGTSFGKPLPPQPVSRVMVSPTSEGVSVQVFLNKPASRYEFDVGNRYVGVTFSERV